MPEANPAIDYEGFKGAGGPSTPPPQKPNTNPTRSRLLLLITSPIMVTVAIFLFSFPFNAAGTLFPHIIGGLCAGLTIAIYDWIIEAYAYQKGLWFCYGGYQKVGKLDFKHVPFDMIISFIGTGFTLAFVSYFPELLRNWGWNFWPISNPALDIWLVPGLLVLVAVGGALGDFYTKRAGVWMNGPTWSYWKCAFLAWLPLLTSGIVVDRLILHFWTNTIGVMVVILTVFLSLTIISVILLKKKL
jgi:hypothetical protein